ncbi:PA-phosphatase related phosphoesterase, partial [Crocosphaera watsonii WH 0003]
MFDSQGQIIPLEDILVRDQNRIIELSYDTRLEGDYSLIIQQSEITDLAGNVVADEDLNEPITVTDDIFTPIIEVNLINDTGNSNSDFITNDPRITGQIIDNSTITEFSALFDRSESGNFVNILEQLEPDGSFTLDETVLNQINGGIDLNDGSQTLILTATDEAGNTLEISEFSFTLDTTTPIPQITSELSNQSTVIEIDFGEEIINGDDLNNYTLTRVGEGEISIFEVVYESEGLVQLTLAEPLIGGANYRLDLDSA